MFYIVLDGMIQKIKEISEYKTNDDYVYCFEMKNKSEPYFTLPNGIITHNCRLRSDMINEYSNSIGGTSTKIGSLGVVTINLPRLAYESKTEEDFFKLLEERVIEVAYINNAKRHILKRRISYGALPLYDLGFMNLNQQYSTCGINGLNECVSYMGFDILNNDGQQFVIKILDCINKVNDSMKKQYSTPHNTEQTPSENSALKLVKKDRYMGFNVDTDMYSNQFIPLTVNADMLERIKLQGLFDKHFSGGAICHINVSEKIEDKELIKDLIRTCAKQNVIYFAINYCLNRCENDHMTVGNMDICSICGKKIVEKYTRVVGFLTNTKNWNVIRREKDFPNRQWYKI